MPGISSGRGGRREVGSGGAGGGGGGGEGDDGKKHCNCSREANDF